MLEWEQILNPHNVSTPNIHTHVHCTTRDCHCWSETQQSITVISFFFKYNFPNHMYMYMTQAYYVSLIKYRTEILSYSEWTTTCRAHGQHIDSTWTAHDKYRILWTVLQTITCRSITHIINKKKDIEYSRIV